METAKERKRKQNAQRAKNLVNDAVKTLVDMLEQGHSEGLRFHLQAVAKHRRYSLSNTLLIGAQRPDATHVEGFRSWATLGRKVKKGEKGIMIRAPFVFRKMDALSGEQSDEVRGFRAAYVFDISQTEGDELPALGEIAGDPLEHLQRLRDYAEANRIVVTYCEEMPELGRSAGGLVTISKGLSPAEEFNTLAHELAHEKLHHTPGQKLPKAVKETEAEAVAFVVCSAIGLDAEQAAADYIGMYQGDADLLRASLERVSTTARKMLDFLEQEPARKAA